MSVLNSMKDNLEKILLPLTAKITENKTMKALQSGMMLTMPISLGVSIIAILSNLPFPGWIDFLRQIGIYGIAQEVVSSTISMLAIYITFAISYNYAKNEKENAVIVAPKHPNGRNKRISTFIFILRFRRYLCIHDCCCCNS